MKMLLQALRTAQNEFHGRSESDIAFRLLMPELKRRCALLEKGKTARAGRSKVDSK